MTVTQQIITIAITAVATIITRFLPFAVFQSKKRETPKFIEYLGKALPAAVFAMLVVYCLRTVEILSGTHGLPELIAIIVVI
ncbi:MAG TPA: branched-chain amino acid transporter AzlD, partial [Ruminococcaceae bacterium]|nr:branched-chain amino acid transporter AzlD [Oscillospiraceae bacterium]